MTKQNHSLTTEERFLLFNGFGKPALTHENNNNAPQGGTFTFVLYSDSALMVDWIITPQNTTERPFESFLLFDKANIPVSPPLQPEDLTQSKKSVAELWAFFWMMTAITIKYIIRGDGVFAMQWIENLNGIIQDIERRINRKPWSYTRGSLTQLQPTPEEQIETIRQICNRMQELQLKVSEFTESEPSMPLAEIETLLSLANK
jgi:hypothetical protein